MGGPGCCKPDWTIAFRGGQMYASGRRGMETEIRGGGRRRRRVRSELWSWSTAETSGNVSNQSWQQGCCALFEGDIQV